MTVDQPAPSGRELDALRSALAGARAEPPLGRAGLAAGEARHGIVLPEPYRTFVADIANGLTAGATEHAGADRPSTEYGLLPLGRLPDGWRTWNSVNWLCPVPFDGSAPRDPAAPFPLTEEWQWEYDYDPDEDLARMTVLHRHGSVVLGTESPGSFWVLVTAGPRRGTVWLLADGGAFPRPDPDETPAGPPGFAGWLAEWSTCRGRWEAR
ncbi:SMI1/KNR4 family protein [Kitasatospora sp. NPDC059160]|uniref:SMI1/KNR4 family protein n=1 Tax=Kitasatospora sp. NPDC059160 TaxID=3346748 RepID=UPI0036B08F3D